MVSPLGSAMARLPHGSRKLSSRPEVYGVVKGFYGGYIGGYLRVIGAILGPLEK